MRRRGAPVNPAVEQLIVENDDGQILLFHTDGLDDRVAGMSVDATRRPRAGGMHLMPEPGSHSPAGTPTPRLLAGALVAGSDWTERTGERETAPGRCP